MSLRILGTHGVSIIRKKNPGAVTGCPENPFISGGETPNTTLFYLVKSQSVYPSHGPNLVPLLLSFPLYIYFASQDSIEFVTNGYVRPIGNLCLQL